MKKGGVQIKKRQGDMVRDARVKLRRRGWVSGQGREGGEEVWRPRHEAAGGMGEEEGREARVGSRS